MRHPSQERSPVSERNGTTASATKNVRTRYQLNQMYQNTKVSSAGSERSLLSALGIQEVEELLRNSTLLVTRRDDAGGRARGRRQSAAPLFVFAVTSKLSVSSMTLF